MASKFPVRKVVVKGDKFWQVDLRRIKLGRKFFKTKVEADAESKTRQVEWQNHGAAAASLSSRQRITYLQAEQRLADAGATIDEAVEFFISNSKKVRATPISDAIKACLSSREQSGVRSGYLRQLKYNLESFGEFAAGKKCSEITPDFIRIWLGNQNWKSQWTKRGRLIDLGTLFSFAVTNRYCLDNPVDAIDNILIERKSAQILTVAQSEALIRACTINKLTGRLGGRTWECISDFIPYLALALFAGIRPEEAMVLTWDNIDLKNKLVRVEYDVAKTRRRRIVPLSDNCIQWLSMGGKLPITQRYWQYQFVKARKRAGITKWAQDMLRHTFISYALPIRGLKQTALDAGNSEDMIYKHYRAVVTEEEARKFWEILPFA